jgi:hypothetical protein
MVRVQFRRKYCTERETVKLAYDTSALSTSSSSVRTTDMANICFRPLQKLKGMLKFFFGVGVRSPMGGHCAPMRAAPEEVANPTRLSVVLDEVLRPLPRHPLRATRWLE